MAAPILLNFCFTALCSKYGTVALSHDPVSHPTAGKTKDMTK